MSSPYNIPIIPQNLSQQEVIIQIGEALNHLSNVTEDIMQKINNRIASNNAALKDISNRVDLVQEKISTLKGAKKATQIFCSAKYPASDVSRPYKSIFEDVNPMEIKRHKVKLKEPQKPKELPQKLEFLHVGTKNVKPKTSLAGLGEMPNDLEFVNDLLLYNSGNNLYRNFIMGDALKMPQIKAEPSSKASQNTLEAAPHSITDRGSLIKTNSYFYTPKIGTVPTLDVPLDLPDLPGIADDLRYEDALGPTIAPSAIEELPSITTEAKAIDLPTPPPPKESCKEPKEVLPKPEVDLPELDIPPPVKIVSVPTPPPPPPPIAPPPPPPPQEISAAANPVVAPDARANLMDAIRKAGGSKNAKLKSTSKTQRREVEAPTTKAPENVSGNLMADLHSKLLLRRKGISGLKETAKEGTTKKEGINASSTLGKISAMIPPPPPSQKDSPSLTNTDEDWDD